MACCCRSEAIDAWALGCVLGELLLCEPLFPARSEVDCLHMMCSLLGSPTPAAWPGMAALPLAAQVAFPHQPHNNLRRRFPGLSDAGLALLGGLLTYDPCKRLSARQALKHAWFREWPLPKSSAAMPTFPSTLSQGGLAAAGAGAGGGEAWGAGTKRPAPAAPQGQLQNKRRSDRL